MPGDKAAMPFTAVSAKAMHKVKALPTEAAMCRVEARVCVCACQGLNLQRASGFKRKTCQRNALPLHTNGICILIPHAAAIQEHLRREGYAAWPESSQE